ncbi:M16 family metallopeptidase [Parvibium lacunae]|uniref:Insulinase family protein n=1 Tax=Parvibium lacunae TaxID=1888893 RepID=A0A368L106_9BURK|nr:pitrilysin family protein [Parvibium lacunae]RCS56984.1 insulinase family protein [Parvibium lacunae]
MNFPRFLSLCLIACTSSLGGLFSAAAHAKLPIETWQTRAGSKVLFVAAPTIPMLDINLDFDAGGRYAPADKVGVAGLTLEMLDKGVQHRAANTATLQPLTEAQLADAFADIGAQLSASPGMERVSIQLRTLSRPTERQQAIALLASIVQRPIFPAELLAREKTNLMATLRDADTKPESILERRFAARLYPDHPYGRRPTVTTVANVSIEDIQRFHQQHYTAQRAVVTLIGQISRAEAEQIAEQLTADLPQALPAAQTSTPAVAPTPQPGIETLPHPASQAHLALGLPSLVRGDPDFFALQVGNYILGGGGFASRLMAEVRDKRGLAYSVYSAFSPQAIPGPFQIGLQTKKEQAQLALQVTRDTLETFLREGPTQAELRAAKANLINGFPLRIDSNRKLLEQLAVIGFYGLPLNYLDDWPRQIERVSLADVRAAFQRKVRLEQLVTVIVGAQ